MLRMLTRGALAAALLVAVPMAGSAHADDVTLSGCYGAATVIVCDPTVSSTVPYTVETYETSVPVCAGTCFYVPVTLLTLEPTGQPLAVCATRYTQAGVPTTTCASVPTAPGTQELVELALGAVDLVVEAVTRCVDDPTTGICRTVDIARDRLVEEILPNLIEIVSETAP